jgi:hypothetical protein
MVVEVPTSTADKRSTYTIEEKYSYCLILFSTYPEQKNTVFSVVRSSFYFLLCQSGRWSVQFLFLFLIFTKGNWSKTWETGVASNHDTEAHRG